MESLIRWVLRHPLPFSLLLMSLTLMAVWQLPSLKVHISPQGLSVHGDPSHAVYEEMIEAFGSDSITILYIKDNHLFDPSKLELTKAAVKLIEELPYVSHVQSLFSVPHLRVENEFIHTEPFLATLPQTPEASMALVSAALASPFVKNNLLSDDGNTLAINIYLKSQVDDLDFDNRVTHNLTEIAKVLEENFEEVFHVGIPQVRNSITLRVWEDAQKIVPLSAFLLFLTLAFVLQSPIGVLTPLLTAGISVILTLGLMAAIDLPLNVMTAVVPILLIIIGTTEDIHLIAEYHDGIEKQYHRKRAILHMAKRMSLAVSLTFLTSFLGFLAVGFNPIEMVREFGMVAAMGLAISFLVTVLTVPVLLHYIGDKKPRSTGSFSIQKVSPRVWQTHYVLSHRRYILLFTLALVGVALYHASTIQVNNSILDYLDEDSTIRQHANTLHRELSGLETFNIIIDGHVDGTFQRVHYLEELEKLQSYLRESPAFDFTISIVDYIKVINGLVNESGSPELPEENNVIETLLLFIKPEQIRPYITEDFSKASIIVRHNLSSSAKLRHEIDKFEQFIDRKIDTDLDIQITGQSILSSHASDHLAISQAQSLIFMLFVIFCVISFLFVNIKAGMLAVIPNIFLVISLFGVMGYFKIPLDTGTAMIAAIALGISVDHTMHFLVRYYSLAQKNQESRMAIEQAAAIEYRPIIAATLSLASGFAVLSLSGFTPVVYFGFLSAIVMLVAFYANFILTPVLLSFVRLMTIWDILTVPMRRSLKTRYAIFQGMNELQIRSVLSLGSIKDFTAGTTIFTQGKESNELYILLSGQVKVSTEDETFVRNVMDNGSTHQIFGSTSLVKGRPYACTAMVTKDTKVLVLDWAQLARIHKFKPKTGSLLFRNLSMIMAELVADKTYAPKEEICLSTIEFSKQN